MSADDRGHYQRRRYAEAAEHQRLGNLWQPSTALQLARPPSASAATATCSDVQYRFRPPPRRSTPCSAKSGTPLKSSVCAARLPPLTSPEKARYGFLSKERVTSSGAWSARNCTTPCAPAELVHRAIFPMAGADVVGDPAANMLPVAIDGRTEVVKPLVGGRGKPMSATEANRHLGVAGASGQLLSGSADRRHRMPASRNPSMSPSKTAEGLPTSKFVRRSLTI